jgi:hypothetical protein
MANSKPKKNQPDSNLNGLSMAAQIDILWNRIGTILKNKASKKDIPLRIAESRSHKRSITCKNDR